MNLFKRVFFALILTCSVGGAFAKGRLICVVGTSSSGKTAITRELGEKYQNSRLVEADNVFLNCMAELAEKETGISFPRNDKNVIAQKCRSLGVFDRVFEAVEECEENFDIDLYSLRLITEISDLLAQDYDVIYDTGVSTEDERKSIAQVFEGIKIYYVLVYCSVPELEHRVNARNSGKQAGEERSLGSVLSDFFGIYRAGNKSEFKRFTKFVDKKDAILSGKQVDEACDRNGQMRFSEMEGCVVYPFKNGQETIKMVPRLKYDCIVNNSKRNAVDRCADKIIEFLNNSRRNVISRYINKIIKWFQGDRV